MAMPALRLHTKTTLLTSVVTVAVIAALLWLVSVRVADYVREEQRQLAELQASNLAEHIANSLTEADTEDLQHAANLVRNSRPNILTVRVWQRVGGVLLNKRRRRAVCPSEIPEDRVPLFAASLSRENSGERA